MNKIDDAWAVLKELPQRQQELAAAAILDFASTSRSLSLSEEQVTLVKARLRESEPKNISSAKLRARFRRLEH